MEEILTFNDLPKAVTRLTDEVSKLKDLLIQKQAERLLNIDEVAELLHLTKPTVYTKHSRGELPGVCKRGKRLYFQRDVIINWIKEGRKKSKAEIEAEADAYLSNNRKGLK